MLGSPRGTLAERPDETVDTRPPPSAAWSPRRVDWVLAITVAAAAVVRFWSLRQSLWYDEFVTTNIVFKGTHLFSNVMHKEGSPPLYFMLLWGWTKAFKGSDATLRSLSALVGTATVPAVYAAAREIAGNRRVARLAAALVAFNPMLVWFSQEARAYASFSFLAALSLYFWARAYRRAQTRDLVLWGLTAAAMLATHYFAVFLIVPEAAWLFFALWPRWRSVVGGLVPVFVVAPLLYFFFVVPQQQTDLQLWVHGSPVRFRVAETGRQALIGPGGWDDRLWMAAAALLMVGVALVVVRGTGRERSTAALLAAVGLVGLLVTLCALAFGSDYLVGRNLIASLIPLAVAAAIVFGTRRAGWLGVGAGVALCALSAFIVVAVDVKPELQKANWRSVAEIIDRNPRDSLVVVPHDSHLAGPLLRYFKSARVVGLDEPVRVQEVDLLYHVPKPVNRCGFFQGRDCEPATFYFPLFPDALKSQFVYSGKPQVHDFAVNQYRPEGAAVITGRPFVPKPTPKGFAVILRRGRHGA